MSDVNKCAVIGKIVLLAVVLCLLFVAGLTDVGLYTMSNEDEGGSVRVSFGVFKWHHGKQKVSTNIRDASNPLDRDNANNPVNTFDNVGCDDLKKAWQGMQACFCLGAISLALSAAGMLLFLCCASATGCWATTITVIDVLMMVFILVFMILIIVIKEGEWTCAGTVQTFSQFDYSYGVFLAGAACLFSLIALCVGIKAKRNQPSHSSSQDYQMQKM